MRDVLTALILITGAIGLAVLWAARGEIPRVIHGAAVAAALAAGTFVSWLRASGTPVNDIAAGTPLVGAALVYLYYGYYRLVHAGDAPPPAPPRAGATLVGPGASDPLAADERARAATLRVWPVAWELPDKSWEALCLSSQEAERTHAAQCGNHLVSTWGAAQRSEPQQLLAWVDGKATASDKTLRGQANQAAREALRRSAAGEPGPIVIRTW
jgi:hypothetical protein